MKLWRTGYVLLLNGEITLTIAIDNRRADSKDQETEQY